MTTNSTSTSQGHVSLGSRSSTSGVWVASILAASILITLLSTALLSQEQCMVLLPAMAIITIFSIFSVLLAKKLNATIFTEIGFLFLGFCVAYSVIPAFNFLVLDFIFPPDGLNFAILSPQPNEIGVHLWRNTLFISMVAMAYLVARGKQTWGQRSTGGISSLPPPFIFLFISLTSIGVIAVLSAPVTNYYEHYTRFQHLSSLGRFTANMALLLKLAGYYVTLFLMFSSYQRYKYFIPPLVILVVAYEMSYSFGSRIESLSILLTSAYLFSVYVRPIRLAEGIVYLFLLALLFTGVEFFRSTEFNINAAIEMALNRALNLASEFNAVFFTSFHIYHEKSIGALPEPHWLMLINDFFTAVPFYEKTQYNSQYWYANIYFPDAIVPPQTMGPLADSGIWGGEIDLAIRGILTGLGYGYFSRWAIHRNAAWYHILIYSYIFSTVVYGLKYSFVYQFSLMTRIMLPAFMLYGAYIIFVRAIRSDRPLA